MEVRQNGLMSRPRDPDLDRRILHATRELIDEIGASDVTIDEVARRAGVGRPTVYRRWATRAELLFAAQSNASAAAEFPDTGSLRGDLVAAVGHLCAVMDASDRTVTGEQLGRMIVDDAFAEEVWSKRWVPDRNAVLVVWERGVERGEVTSTVDGAAVIDDLVAMCLFRVFFGHQTPEQIEVSSIVDRMLDGVLADPSAPGPP